MTITNDTSYVLQYWSIRGRGELSRLILTAANANWSDEVIERADWPALKPSKPFGQVPVLVEYQGGEEVFRLAQSHAIERYLAARHGLAGDDERENAFLDAVGESFVDLAAGFRKLRFAADGEKEKAREEFFNLLGSTLKFHEGILKRNGNSGFYLRDKSTYIDLTAFHAVETYLAAEKEGVEKALAQAPGVKAVYERVRADPVIAKYLNSPNRKP
ncbi:hypothetical protein HK101_009018 [Irineochytrium annulatum]|nr:hypothetical protein HK101_009018 [Irineochytrium annulatum]